MRRRTKCGWPGFGDRFGWNGDGGGSEGGDGRSSGWPGNGDHSGRNGDGGGRRGSDGTRGGRDVGTRAVGVARAGEVEGGRAPSPEEAGLLPGAPCKTQAAGPATAELSTGSHGPLKGDPAGGVAGGGDPRTDPDSLRG
ncbi:GL15195 [Drosophila persimilis]|uniref:GL15195 n=1 Tax=Drosophila persimilis TaxID=7234 RepID=B4H3K7_DROPE|nr:GL15195 [Drosophila persimilis]